MGGLIDETGKVYGRLTVLAQSHTQHCGHARWKCECSCGGDVITTGKRLRNGDCQSCGCLRIERLSNAVLKHGQRRQGESGRRTRSYNTWGNLISRHKDQVCARWLEFVNFYEDMGYKPQGSIFKIYKDGKELSKNNCKWVPESLQEVRG